jgi:hypothetical protein
MGPADVVAQVTRRVLVISRLAGDPPALATRAHRSVPPVDPFLGTAGEGQSRRHALTPGRLYVALIPASRIAGTIAATHIPLHPTQEIQP